MKKILLLLTVCAAFAACGHESIDDRAAREAKEFTRKNCPTPPINNTRTDSMTFDRDTRTLTYYMSLTGVADNAEAINANREQMHQALLNALVNATNLKAYKDASISFRYVYRSDSNPGTVLYDALFTKKEYGS